MIFPPYGPPPKKPSREEGFLGLKKEGGLRRFCHPSGLGKLGSDWGRGGEDGGGNW